MTPEEAELDAISFLTSQGFSVQRIPTASAARRADLAVSTDTEQYVIEVHARNSDQKYFEQLRTKHHAELEHTIEHQARLADVFRDKNKQLRDTPTPESSLRVLWLACVGADPTLQARQIVATWFGAVDVYTFAGTTPCYFFDFASSFKMLDTDAVIVRVGPSGLMLPNPFSPRAKALGSSLLAQRFQHAAKYIDPSADEKAGNAFLADDFPGQRNTDEHDSQRESFLKVKYSLKEAHALRWKNVKAAVIVPDTP